MTTALDAFAFVVILNTSCALVYAAGIAVTFHRRNSGGGCLKPA
jgi:hypothetical protein